MRRAAWAMALVACAPASAPAEVAPVVTIAPAPSASQAPYEVPLRPQLALRPCTDHRCVEHGEAPDEPVRAISAALLEREIGLLLRLRDTMPPGNADQPRLNLRIASAYRDLALIREREKAEPALQEQARSRACRHYRAVLDDPTASPQHAAACAGIAAMRR